MPTTVDILTFISMINTTSETLKARNFFIYEYFSFYEQLKFRVQLSSVRNNFVFKGYQQASIVDKESSLHEVSSVKSRCE